MKISIITLFSLLCAVSAIADDGWFRMAVTEERPKAKIVDKHLIYRVPLVEAKVPVRSVLLRADAEDEAVYWIVLGIGKLMDPGDGYFLGCGDVALSEWKWRGMEEADTCKWAHKIRDLDAARRVLAIVAKIHKLAAMSVCDQTKVNMSE